MFVESMMEPDTDWPEMPEWMKKLFPDYPPK